MAVPIKLPIVLLLLSCLVLVVTATRPGVEITLTRLDGEAGMTECWSAFLELKSCTNEIVLVFINGESYLGMDCCRAICTITHWCWPSMLTSLGYTAEEGDILSDYCGASIRGGLLGEFFSRYAIMVGKLSGLAVDLRS